MKVGKSQDNYDEKNRKQLKLDFFQTKPYSVKYTLISYDCIVPGPTYVQSIGEIKF